MQNIRRICLKVSTALIALIAALLIAHPAFAQEQVLHRFQGNEGDGTNPWSGFVFDSAGNAFGTTSVGGNGFGTVYELTPQTDGTWTETVIYSFLGGTDGSICYSTLFRDASGNLYGTTYSGGAYDLGTVFELSPSGTTWTEAILYDFKGNPDGANPQAGVTMDPERNIYGTTYSGGTKDFGTAFELSPVTGGGWSESVLHTFVAGMDGAHVYGGVILDSAGNIFGTTQAGGINNTGTIFELSPQAGGTWTETILHHLNADTTEGYWPFDALVQDASGILYGTTSSGGTGPCFCGTIFEVKKDAGGTWIFRVIHNFQGKPGDGNFSYAGLTLDTTGNLYGATELGGVVDAGTVYKINPRTIEIKLVYSFNFRQASQPLAAPVFDAAGNLFGTTNHGGSTNGCPPGCGIAYRLTP